ncbi:MAG: NAD(P)/FAD-dependent oxidoreductase, partial [Candidatus Diapherotrites archaeon]|nr:NAD(P)/FAD-dependent oxidoreductase [Candidatus Diapherotrites archaeon]
MEHFNVVVVGAGPAGASASFFLKHLSQDKGLKVLLLDRLTKDQYGVYHRICGEAISDYAFKNYLRPLKPESVVEDIHTLQLYSPSFNVKINVKGYVLNRDRFFNSIIDKFVSLGGVFRRNTVVDITDESSKVVMTLKDGSEISADYVIACDGANSTIRKALGVEAKHVVPLIQYITDHEAKPGVLEFFFREEFQPLYKWIFPNGKSAKVGFPLIAGKNYEVEGKILDTRSRVVCY